MALGLPRDLLRVTVLSAERRVSLELVAITAAYALGATVPFVRAGCSATARWRCVRREAGVEAQAGGPSADGSASSGSYR